MTRKRFAVVLLALVIGFGTCGVALWAAGLDAPRALRALVNGAFGDSHRVAIALLRSTPLLLTGLGVAVAFRAGLWNIGAEGQMLVGAIAVTACATRTSVGQMMLAPVILMLCGAIAGACWGGLAAVLKASRGVPEVISTIMLNFVAIEAVSWVVQGPLREASGRYPQTDAIPAAGSLGAFVLIPAGLLIGMIVALLLQVLIDRTRIGLEMRAVGSNRVAARVAGIRVDLQTLWVLALSGGIAGLAGAAEMLGSVHRLYEGYAPGYGYTAIAVALLGRLQPLAVIPSALFFGGLQAGAESMERQAGVPAVLSTVMQAIVILAAVYAWRSDENG